MSYGIGIAASKRDNGLYTWGAVDWCLPIALKIEKPSYKKNVLKKLNKGFEKMKNDDTPTTLEQLQTCPCDFVMIVEDDITYLKTTPISGITPDGKYIDINEYLKIK